MSAIEDYRKDIITTRNLIRELEGLTEGFISKVRGAEKARDAHLQKILSEEERLDALNAKVKGMIEDGSWLEQDFSTQEEPDVVDDVHAAVAAIADPVPETADASGEEEEWTPAEAQADPAEEVAPIANGSYNPWA